MMSAMSSLAVDSLGFYLSGFEACTWMAFHFVFDPPFFIGTSNASLVILAR
jgi:hypothetical protein